MCPSLRDVDTAPGVRLRSQHVHMGFGMVARVCARARARARSRIHATVATGWLAVGWMSDDGS